MRYDVEDADVLLVAVEAYSRYPDGDLEVKQY